jgi:ABC-2 type transport system ATP-binding protein
MQIVMHNLSKIYPGGLAALNNVSLSLGTGMFGLLGPNGAGKTTMMRILATLLEPTSGEVTIGGLELRSHRSEIRKILGYLSQEFGAYPGLRVFEFIDYIASLDGVGDGSGRKKLVEEALGQVGLFEVRDRKIKKLSGGMLRRLGVAQALIGKPKLLIVDEPTVGLDPEERIKFRALLQEIGREIVIILSTHIVGDIGSTCEKLALLNKGTVVFQGSPQALIQKAEGRTWELEVEEREFSAVKDRFSVIATATEGGRLRLRVVGEDRGGFPVKPVKPNLEDAYIYTMEKIAAVDRRSLDNAVGE